MLSNSRIAAYLHTDHMATIAQLQELEDLIRAKAAPVLTPQLRQGLADLAATLRREVEGHFGFEEDHVFPEFLKLGESGIVMMLTHEHRSILPLASQTAALAEAALAEGAFAPQLWQEFRDTAAELVEREIFHIQKEEMGLLGAITHLLNEEIDSRLADAYVAKFGAA